MRRGPNLAARDHLNALAEGPERAISETEQPTHSGAEGVDDRFTIGRLEPKNLRELGMSDVNSSDQTHIEVRATRRARGEAMGAGLCVLASDIPENRELVDRVGFTFRAGNVVDLERMLRRLIADPALLMEPSRRAKERIREHYSWPKITREIEDVYWQLMD